MNIMEIIKNRKWTSTAEWIIDGSAALRVWTPMGGNEKGGEMNYNSTGTM